MYKEIHNKKNTVLLNIFLIIVAGLIFITLTNYFSFGNFRSFYELGVGILTVLAVLDAVRRNNKAFKYQISNNEIVIKKISKKHEKTILDVDIDKIIVFSKCGSDDIKSYKCSRARHFCTTLSQNNDYVVIYDDNGTIKSFYFEPSAELINLIKQKIHAA